MKYWSRGSHTPVPWQRGVVAVSSALDVNEVSEEGGYEISMSEEKLIKRTHRRLPDQTFDSRLYVFQLVGMED